MGEPASASLFEQFTSFVADVMTRGGIVMWPLLGLSVLSVALCIERSIFWIRLNGGGRTRWLQRLNAALRTGDRETGEKLLRGDRSAYAAVAAKLLDSGASDAVATEAIEAQRPSIDRFMTILSTVITAAPMLGILGTVLGIIDSFRVLSSGATSSDTRLVSQGIAEALITTAAGLIVALAALFPYMLFRSRADRALGRFETIIAAAQEGRERRGGR
ncbi:MAG: MotA/TolQ/ExbB proton channel family protein [Phycisphaerales bacterium]|nr:MotA/TolQ/ExbB proton channel family protein [Phycisphaerales bacterium]